jgi:hypothetical protein
VAGAYRYRVQVAQNPGFSGPVYSADTFATQATPQPQLPLGLLYWRVAGEDNASNLGPFAQGTFTRSVGSAPVTITPTNDQVLTFPTEPVILSWEPVPGASQYSISLGTDPGLVGATVYTNATNNTSYTLTDTQAFTATNGTAQKWYWAVQATFLGGAVSAWSTPIDYSVVWPAVPQLESPTYGAVVTDVVFSWDPVPGAQSYEIQVSASADFQSTLVDAYPMSTRWAPYPTLNNASYFWRVRARADGSAVNWGGWSTPSMFTRGWSPRPVTVWPHWTGGTADPPSVPYLRFDWTPAAATGSGWVDHASYYEIQIGTDRYFSDGTYSSCTTNHTTFSPYAGINTGGEPAGCNVPVSFAIGTPYYWRVRAIDGPSGVLGLWDSTGSSDTQRFIYDPSVPDLSCGSHGTVATPVLCWSPVAGAEKYLVTIQDRLGAIVVSNFATYGLSYTPTSALTAANGPFTWTAVTVDMQSHAGYIKASQTFSLTDPATVTPLTLITPAADAHSIRMPSMTWEPFPDAAYYKVWYGPTDSTWYTTPLSGGSHLPYAGFTYSDVPLPSGRYYWKVEAFASGDASLGFSDPRPFSVGDDGSGDWVVPWSDYKTPECVTQTDPSSNLCEPLLGDTQELSWTPDPNAGAYSIYVSKDPNFTNIYRQYKTSQPFLTPKESWLDDQAGAYFWYVRLCVDWNMTDCGPGPASNAGLDNASAYKKISPAVGGLSTTTAANPPLPSSTIADQITFNWSDYLTTSQGSAYPVVSPTPAISGRVTQEAKEYRIQVSTDSHFGSLLDQQTVETTQYTPSDRTYPEGPIFWRVQALDGSGNFLTMSSVQTVTKASPAVILNSPADTATATGVPFFTWTPQNWAARYQVEVYQNGDTNWSSSNRVFQVTTSVAAWSPTSAVPAGLYAWRVRRYDHDNLPGPWSAGRTFTLQPAAPTLIAPANASQLNGANLLFTWNGIQSGVSYRFQTSSVADFASTYENLTTVMTAWSPVNVYGAGTYYWRVSLLDASNNVMSTSSSRTFLVGTLPGAPTNAHATAGNASATVTWTAPVSSGSSPITGYIVTSSPDGQTCTTTGAATCTVGSLTNGQAYTFTVQATTGFGTGPASDPSNSVTPAAVNVLVVTAATTQSHGVAFNVTVRDTDGVGSTQASYRGTVHFTSTDVAAGLPSNYTFIAADNGQHVFSVTLNSYGTYTVTATDTIVASLTGSQAGIVVGYPASTYHPISPKRVLDTRAAGNIGLSGKFVAGTVRTFGVAGVHYIDSTGKATTGTDYAVPPDAVAVTGNLTIVNETVAGLVAVGPTMTPTGEVTTINFVKGDICANNVTVGVSGTGALSAVYRASGGTTDVIFDVTGYFQADTSGATYHTVAPGRVLDTRPTKNAVVHIGPFSKLTNLVPKSFPVAGVIGIGWTTAQVPGNATAVTGNLTVANATKAGFVSVGPTMTNKPTTSTINVAAGNNRANGVTVQLQSGSLGIVWYGGAGSSADVLFDVTGYFTGDLTGLQYHAIVPVRLLNTAVNKGLSGAFATGTARTLGVGSSGQVPADAAGISGNLTVVNPSTAGYAFVAPTISGPPPSSTLNLLAHTNIANGLDVALNTGNLQLIWMGPVGSTATFQLDVTGYWK